MLLKARVPETMSYVAYKRFAPFQRLISLDLIAICLHKDRKGSITVRKRCYYEVYRGNYREYSTIPCVLNTAAFGTCKVPFPVWTSTSVRLGVANIGKMKRDLHRLEVASLSLTLLDARLVENHITYNILCEF